ncbi:hypothetical protein Ae201684P_007456 [Aphanomyces euteiches]|nr:hypothetical protein Ae201684P_007456 [Aphanomyces euteiches]
MKLMTTLAQTAGVTIADLAKLSWASTLRKNARRNDVVIGEVLSNRDIPVKDADRILGPLISTVPCRVRFDDESSVLSLLLSIQFDRISSTIRTLASQI